MGLLNIEPFWIAIPDDWTVDELGSSGPWIASPSEVTSEDQRPHYYCNLYELPNLDHYVEYTEENSGQDGCPIITNSYEAVVNGLAGLVIESQWRASADAPLYGGILCHITADIGNEPAYLILDYQQRADYFDRPMVEHLFSGAHVRPVAAWAIYDFGSFEPLPPAQTMRTVVSRFARLDYKLEALYTHLNAKFSEINATLTALMSKCAGIDPLMPKLQEVEKWISEKLWAHLDKRHEFIESSFASLPPQFTKINSEIQALEDSVGPKLDKLGQVSSKTVSNTDALLKQIKYITDLLERISETSGVTIRK